ncbi:MAG: hypothetical protein K2X77_32985 [Candidatus Obscuribacterales bacterium]|nr:hypothetical protein [Candidatus Obscuribacterales bacterium]
MSSDDDDGGNIAPSFEEQIRHLRKKRNAKGTLFEKTTEHNVAKKLVRELDTKGTPVTEEVLDSRLQETLNREANADMYAMFDSLTASLTGYKRRETKTFRAPAPVADAGSNSTYAPAPRLVARATKQYQIYTENGAPSETSSTNIRQATSEKQLPSREEEMVVGEARPEQNQTEESGSDQEFILGRTATGKTAHPRQVRTFPDGEEREVAGSNFPTGEEQRPTAQAPIARETFPAGLQQTAPQQYEGSANSIQETESTADDADLEPISRQDLEPISRQDAGAPGIEPNFDEQTFRDYEEATALSDYEETSASTPERSEPGSAGFQPASSERSEPGSAGFQPASSERPVYSPPPAQQAQPAAFEFNTEFIQEMAVFTAQTGLDLVVNSATTMQVLLTAAGATSILHEVPLNENGIEEARILASSLLNFYMLSLRDDFNIEFGHFGEIAVHQYGLNAKNQLVPTKALFVRPPRLDELKAVHSALEYSWPASAQPDEQLPMRIVFVNDVLVQGEEAGARLKFGEDGRPLLFITPALCANGVPTEHDVVDGFTESWQIIVMRELAWKTLADCKKLPLSADDCETLGWIEVSKDANLYILRTTNGEFYYPNPDPEVAEQAWLRVNHLGEYVNNRGAKVANHSEIIFKSAEEIASIAEVPPVGMLFHSPEEELADALTLYRLGIDTKSRMLSLSPAIYRLAKQIDQSSINRWYVPTKTYAGLLRAPSGALVDHTQQNLDAMFEFEHSN